MNESTGDWRWIFVFLGVMAAALSVVFMLARAHKKKFRAFAARRGLTLVEHPTEDQFPHAFDEYTVRSAAAFRKVQMIAGPSEGVQALIRIKKTLDSNTQVAGLTISRSTDRTPQICFLFALPNTQGIYRFMPAGWFFAKPLASIMAVEHWWAGVTRFFGVNELPVKPQYIELEKSAHKVALAGGTDITVMNVGDEADALVQRAGELLRKLFDLGGGLLPVVTIAGGYALVELPRAPENIKNLDALYDSAVELRRVLAAVPATP